MASALTPDTAPEPVERSPWQRWVGFWFPAADPTTLGFMRICTGLLVLYIHLAYSVDLQQFFGKQGWYSWHLVEKERQEYPWRVSPFLSWDPQPAVSAPVPDFPHRRKPVVDFMYNLPAEKGRRQESLRFLVRLAGYDNADAAVIVIAWFQKMGTTVEMRDRYLKALVAGRTTAPTDGASYFLAHTPDGLLALPQADREQLANEVKAFWAVLPDDQIARTYVLNHLAEMGFESRRSFVEFLDTLPADEAARKKRIAYLDYWNAEPERAVRTGHMIFSVWFHVTDPTQMALVHVGVLLLIAVWTLGLFTRITSVLVWLAIVGYIHRTQQVLFGMDTMMNILVFYLMVGNCGAALSLDRLVARYRAARASLRRTGTIDPATRAFLACPPPSTGAGFGLRLIQVHFCFIYVAAGLAKLKGAAWWNGQAFWDVVVNPEFTLMQYQWYEDWLRATASIKPVYYLMAAGGCWFTLFIEIAGPFLLWTRLRWLIIFLASLMHAIIGVMMGLNLFELLMIVMLLAYLPDAVVRDRFRGGPGLAKLAFAFGAAPTSARAAALVVAADTEAQVTLIPEAALAVPTVTDPTGKKVSGADGVTALFRSVRLLSIVSFVLWVPGVRGLLAKRLFPPPASAQAPPAPQPPAPTAAS